MDKIAVIALCLGIVNLFFNVIQFMVPERQFKFSDPPTWSSTTVEVPQERVRATSTGGKKKPKVHDDAWELRREMGEP